MTLLLLLITLAVVGAVAAVASGAVTGGLDDPVSTVPARALPQGPPTPRDVAALRFVPALRGYRMDQVDAAMDRLGAELERLHREIAERDRRLALVGAAGYEERLFVPGADEADDPGDTEVEHGPATGGFTPRPARDPQTGPGGIGPAGNGSAGGQGAGGQGASGYEEPR